MSLIQIMKFFMKSQWNINNVKVHLKKYVFLSVSTNQWIHMKCYCCVCQAVLSGCTVRAGCAGCPVWSRTWTSAPSTWTAQRLDWSETLWSLWNPVWTSWMVTWVSYSVSILHISMFSDRFCSKCFQEYNKRTKSIQNQNGIKWEVIEKKVLCYLFSSCFRYVSVLHRAVSQTLLLGHAFPLCDWSAA